MANERFAVEDNKARHDYRNATQTLALIDGARRRGLTKLYRTGMEKLDSLESQIRSYAPSEEEAEEHADYLRLIEDLRTSS